MEGRMPRIHRPDNKKRVDAKSLPTRRAVIAYLDPNWHRRLKFLSFDTGETIALLARRWIITGIEAAEKIKVNRRSRTMRAGR
jgi:hypothetical protein